MTSNLEGPQYAARFPGEHVAKEGKSSLGQGDSIAPFSSHGDKEQLDLPLKLTPKQLVDAHTYSRGSVEAHQRANGIKPKFEGASYKSFWTNYDNRNRT